MNRRILYVIILFCTACSGGGYYNQQLRIYKDATEKIRLASTVEEVDSLNKELSYALMTLEKECRDEKAVIMERSAANEELYKAELEELLKVQRGFVDVAYNKRYSLMKDKNID